MKEDYHKPGPQQQPFCARKLTLLRQSIGLLSQGGAKRKKTALLEGLIVCKT